MRPLGGSRMQGIARSQGSVIGPIYELNIEGMLYLTDFSIMDLNLS